MCQANSLCTPVGCKNAPFLLRCIKYLNLSLVRSTSLPKTPTYACHWHCVLVVAGGLQRAVDGSKPAAVDSPPPTLFLLLLRLLLPPPCARHLQDCLPCRTRCPHARPAGAAPAAGASSSPNQQVASENWEPKAAGAITNLRGECMHATGRTNVSGWQGASRAMRCKLV